MWEDNIKIDLRDPRHDVNSIQLPHAMDLWRALVNTVMNFSIPQKEPNYLNWTTITFSRNNLNHELWLNRQKMAFNPLSAEFHLVNIFYNVFLHFYANLI
jgi:hypothetical protein